MTNAISANSLTFLQYHNAPRATPRPTPTVVRPRGSHPSQALDSQSTLSSPNPVRSKLCTKYNQHGRTEQTRPNYNNLKIAGPLSNALK